LKAVNEYLGSGEGRSVLTKQIAEKVQSYLSDAQHAQNLIAEFLQSKQGKDAIVAAIAEKMNSPSVKQLVRDSIEEALKPAVGMLMNDLTSSAARTIVEAGALAINPEYLSKGGPTGLEAFLREVHVHPLLGQLVDRINHSDVPAVLELLEKLKRGSNASITETMTLAESLRDRVWTRLSESNQAIAP